MPDQTPEEAEGRRTAQGTNMLLEGILSQIRQSVAYGKHKPSMEKLASLGLLSQLMSEHDRHVKVKAGRRSDLLSQGVPLQLVRQTSSAFSRPDVSWRNIRHAAWCRGHPGASEHERRVKIEHLSLEWKAMSQEQQGLELAKLRIGQDKDEGDRCAGDGNGEGSDSDVEAPDTRASHVSVANLTPNLACCIHIHHRA